MTRTLVGAHYTAMNGYCLYMEPCEELNPHLLNQCFPTQGQGLPKGSKNETERLQHD